MREAPRCVVWGNLKPDLVVQRERDLPARRSVRRPGWGHRGQIANENVRWRAGESLEVEVRNQTVGGGVPGVSSVDRGVAEDGAVDPGLGALERTWGFLFYF